jgi:hypothetical protein
MACITESGRILEFSNDPKVRVLELVNGSWVTPTHPVSADEDFNARKLSDAELAQILRRTQADAIKQSPENEYEATDLADTSERPAVTALRKAMQEKRSKGQPL